ncbi:hypothetical protein ElyMa_005600400 [Elysia marginata]|uniref:Uncharacterized protein n=1 Tax=Elysia marginata TaxID=1093978 RepID=A0AAV4F6R0_9GAST|nr:hypothetical protein ElyMa_005600400 [Elysia marginata]
MSAKAFSLVLFAVSLAVSAGQAIFGNDNLGLLYNYNDVYNPLGVSGMNMPAVNGGMQNLRRLGTGRQRVFRFRNLAPGMSQRDLLYDSRVTGYPASFLNNYGLGQNVGRVYDMSMSSVPYDPLSGLMYRAPVNSASNVGSLLI